MAGIRWQDPRVADATLDRGADAPDTSPEALKRFFEAVAVLQQREAGAEDLFDFLGPGSSYRTESDEVLAYTNFMIEAQPSAALKVLTSMCKNAPGDDALCFIGVRLVEALLDIHWSEIGACFQEGALARCARPQGQGGARPGASAPVAGRPA